MTQYQPTPEEQRWLDSADTEFTTADLFLADQGGEIVPAQEPSAFVQFTPDQKVVYARARLPRVTSLGIACMGMAVAVVAAVPYLLRSPNPVATVSNVQPMENVSVSSPGRYVNYGEQSLTTSFWPGDNTAFVTLTGSNTYIPGSQLSRDKATCKIFIDQGATYFDSEIYGDKMAGLCNSQF